MDNEILDLDKIDASEEQKLQVKDRYAKLSEKMTLTSKERDEALAKAQAEAEAKVSLEKERDFYKDFSANVSKYPNASEYQDKILEKVKSGYSTEDAMVAVLAKEGKLNINPETVTPTRNIQAEGGSAPTSFEGEKTLDNMTPVEKLDALKDIDKTGGLANMLRGGR